MNFTKYIWKNARWNANRLCFEGLCALPTTENMLIAQLQKLGERYYPERKKVDLLQTEFCLNDIALKRPITPSQKVAMQAYDGFWQTFLRLKNTFDKDYLTFPASDVTRIEQIAILIAKCTQFCLSKSQLTSILDRCEYLLDLNEREVQFLPQAVELYKINYYCALVQNLFKGNHYASSALAKFLNNDLLKEDFVENESYRQATYCGQKILSVCDCMGNSLATFNGQNYKVMQRFFVYKKGTNCFDTFCKSKLGQNTAEFFSQTKSLKVSQKYFVSDCYEVRTTTLTNLSKSKSNYLLEVKLDADSGSFCQVADALCWSNDHLAVATAIVFDNKIVSGKVYHNSLCVNMEVAKNSSKSFEVVTAYAKDLTEIAQKLQNLQYFGATRCHHITDNIQQVPTGQKLRLTPNSSAQRKIPSLPTKQLNFTYQLGNDDVATFVDNDGNNATLLGGFVFGTTGEKVYSVHCGKITQINCGRFVIDGKLVFDNDKSSCTVSHCDKKSTTVCHKTRQRTLFYFPLERQSKITLDGNCFTVDDGKRKYFVECVGEIESYTTNGMECNSNRLRYKLSNDLQCGNALAITFAPSNCVTVNLANSIKTPRSAPLIQESLVSTYLNYVNGKQVFCLSNFLKRPTALALAGVCYTNSDFVKQYIQRLWQNKQSLCYYDGSGKLQNSFDSLLFDLACVYYATLVKEDNFPTDKMRAYVNAHLTTQRFDGTSLAIQALALKKASQLSGFDKVKCLVEYTAIKKILCSNTTLYPYAQAIGAIALINPSKERLKDLCNKFDIPKNWYYVSQLENLYGLRLQSNSLSITPTVSAENVLEQFALNFGKNRIQTTFAKGTVQSMILNGTACHQPFDPYALTQEENTLVVRY